jgi:enoyl-CoA hydratase/carnithine racemase
MIVVEGPLRVARRGAVLEVALDRPKANAIDAAMIVQSFALEKADRLLELDINPLLVLAEGDGAIAVDVLIRFTGEDDCG